MLARSCSYDNRENFSGINCAADLPARLRSAQTLVVEISRPTVSALIIVFRFLIFIKFSVDWL